LTTGELEDSLYFKEIVCLRITKNKPSKMRGEAFSSLKLSFVKQYIHFYILLAKNGPIKNAKVYTKEKLDLKIKVPIYNGYIAIQRRIHLNLYSEEPFQKCSQILLCKKKAYIKSFFANR